MIINAHIHVFTQRSVPRGFPPFPLNLLSRKYSFFKAWENEKSRLISAVATLAAMAEGEQSVPYRRFVEFGYRTKKSWSRFRRMVGKAEVLKGTRWARASIGQIRLQLFKIGARVRISSRRVHFELASAFPAVKDFAKAHAQLSSIRMQT